MSEKTPRLNAVEITAVLHRHGFILVSQSGSHQKWFNQETRRQVIVPFHQAKQLPIGTLKSIIAGSGIPESELH
jgi:predicted RNA binding protein YcfA (HicA-like mRNA interferase family)